MVRNIVIYIYQSCFCKKKLDRVMYFLQKKNQQGSKNKELVNNLLLIFYYITSTLFNLVRSWSCRIWNKRISSIKAKMSPVMIFMNLFMRTSFFKRYLCYPKEKNRRFYHRKLFLPTTSLRAVWIRQRTADYILPHGSSNDVIATQLVRWTQLMMFV